MHTSQTFLSNRSYVEQVFWLLLVWLLSFGLFYSLAISVLLIAEGKGAIEILRHPEQSPEAINLLKLVQFILSIGVFAVPALVFSLLKSGNLFRYVQVNTAPAWKGIIFTVICVILSAPLVFSSYYVNQHIHLPDQLQWLETWLRNMEEENNSLLETFIQMHSPVDLIINMIIIAVIPAITEELLFRGTLQRFIQEWTGHPHFAIFITGFIFSFIHFQFYGFLPRFILGVLFGYIFYWSSNLWYPIIAHFIFNGTQVVIQFFYQQGYITVNPDEIETVPWGLTAITLFLLILTLAKFQRFLTPENQLKEG